MKKRTGKISEFSSVYNAHKAQIPALRKLTSQALEITDILSKNISKLPFFLRENVDFNLYALADLNESIVQILETNRTCSAEALSRVAIEQAVNLIYTIECTTDDRAKSLISYHLAKSTKDADNWLQFAKSQGLEESVKSAQRKIQHLKSCKDMLDVNRQLSSNEEWPRSVKKRFDLIGIESLYHTIFSASSDAIHGFHEDIFNSTILQCTPNEIRDDAFRGYLAEKRSFSVYLSVYSVALYIQALYDLAIKVEAQDIAEELKSMVTVVNSMITTHENDHKQFAQNS